MQLFFRKSGTGPSLIILHGLYGSSDNWYSIARELSDTFTVYLVDQRNHGNSPHDPEHNYAILAADLNEFMQQHHIEKALIMGHSMGGKTALFFGLKYPEKVIKMIVVDISPLGYGKNSESLAGSEHMKIIRTLLTIDMDRLTRREDAGKILMKTIPSAMVRQFLLKSLKRTKDGKFHWALNIHALHDNMPAIFDGVIEEEVTDPRGIPQFPLLFIKGERSDYMGTRDIATIRHYFPWAGITVVAGAGHWLHAEQPGAFLNAVRDFIK